MATQTSGDLQLSKPAASDLVKNFRTPYNSNMDTIDTAVTALNSKLTFQILFQQEVTSETGHINIPASNGYRPVIASSYQSQPVIKFRYLNDYSLDIWLAAGDVGTKFDLGVLYIRY